MRDFVPHSNLFRINTVGPASMGGIHHPIAISSESPGRPTSSSTAPYEKNAGYNSNSYGIISPGFTSTVSQHRKTPPHSPSTVAIVEFDFASIHNNAMSPTGDRVGDNDVDDDVHDAENDHGDDTSTDETADNVKGVVGCEPPIDVCQQQQQHIQHRRQQTHLDRIFEKKQQQQICYSSYHLQKQQQQQVAYTLPPNMNIMHSSKSTKRHDSREVAAVSASFKKIRLSNRHKNYALWFITPVMAR